MAPTLYQAQLTLVIADKICAALSIVGSSFMARDIFRKWRNKRANRHLPPKLNLLANICVADIGYSFFPHFLSTWMTPKEDGYPLAAGNEATCFAQGFLAIFFLGAGVSLSCVLAFTYWLTICKKKPERELRTRKWKALLYCYSWAFGLIFAASSRYIVKPSEFTVSWAYCTATFGEKGSIGFKVWGGMVTSYAIALFIIIFLCMTSLIWFVYQTEKKMDKYSVEVSTSANRFSRQVSTYSGMGDGSRKQTIAATKQGLCYIVAFQFVLIPIIVYSLVYTLLDQNLPNWVWILSTCMKGIQGFLNACIYFHPKYVAARKQKGLSPFQALGQVLDISEPCCLCSADKAQDGDCRASVLEIPVPNCLPNASRPADKRKQQAEYGDCTTGITLGSTYQSRLSIPGAKVAEDGTYQSRLSIPGAKVAEDDTNVEKMVVSSV